MSRINVQEISDISINILAVDTIANPAEKVSEIKALSDSDLVLLLNAIIRQLSK